MNRLFCYSLFVFFGLSALAQETVISPYYPAPEEPYHLTDGRTQVTYYDFDFVSSRIQKFMEGNMGMTIDNSLTQFKPLGADTVFSLTYKTKVIGNTEPRQITFNFKLFDIGYQDKQVVQWVRASGDPYELTFFYVSYWTNDLNTDDVQQRGEVKQSFRQDRSVYQYNNGQPSIVIENTHYTNGPEAFAQELHSKLSKPETSAKIKTKEHTYHVVKNKRGKVEVTNAEGSMDWYESRMATVAKIESLADDLEAGEYSVACVYKIIDGNPAEVTMEATKQ